MGEPGQGLRLMYMMMNEARIGLANVTDGTDTHLLQVDLLLKGVKCDAVKKALGRGRITCNKNGIFFDDEKPTITSGGRLGTPAGITRGFTEIEFRQIGDWILVVVDGLAASDDAGNPEVEARVAAEVQQMCTRFHIYQTL